jgi:hypothetical protein
LEFPEIPAAVKKITTMAGYYQKLLWFSNEKEVRKQGSKDIRIFNAVSQFPLFFYFFISFFSKMNMIITTIPILFKRRCKCIAQNAEKTISKTQIYVNLAASQYQPHRKYRRANQKQANLRYGLLSFR